MSSSSESVGIEFSEENNVLLMSLMEETQEEEYYGDDRLVSMIQSLEAEIINDPVLGHVDSQDCSTSLGVTDHHWVDMELVNSSPFDEMNNEWIPYGDHEMEHNIVTMEYEGGNYEIDDFQSCYGVFLEQQYRETYLSTDAVFSN